MPTYVENSNNSETVKFNILFKRFSVSGDNNKDRVPFSSCIAFHWKDIPLCI